LAWSGQDLENATSAAGALLEEMRLDAYLFAVEPREGDWELKLECALQDGWQMIALPVDLELLLASRTERSARGRLLRSWGERLKVCLKREDREPRVPRAGEARAPGQPSRRLVPAAKKPGDWNVLVTAQPGPQHTRPLLGGLRQYGEFRGTEFRDVCIGWVDEVGGFLESVRVAAEAHSGWIRHLSRVIPVERTFRFVPETLVALLTDAVTPLVERIVSGSSLYVRVERRGLMGQVSSAEVERAVADYVFELASRRGKTLHASFDDPDYILVAETVGERCGLGWLTREMRRHYPFVQPR
jgi:tRNA(Ser,Leu) C12 N-acetylase TAN1